MSTLYGQLAATGRIVGRSWDPRVGWSTVRSYVGPEVSLDAIESTLVSNGIRTDRRVSESNSYGEVRGYFSDEDEGTSNPNEPLSTIWSRVSNDIELSIWEAPKAKAALAAMSSEQNKGLLRKWIEQLAKGDVENLEAVDASVNPTLESVLEYANTNFGLPAAHNATITRVLSSLIRGVESIPLSQYVVRRVAVIPANGTDVLKPSDDNVNKLYATAAAFSAAEAVPATLKFRLPEGYYWKRVPQVEQMDGRVERWRVTSDFFHTDEYDTLLFEEAT